MMVRCHGVHVFLVEFRARQTIKLVINGLVVRIQISRRGDSASFRFELLLWLYPFWFLPFGFSYPVSFDYSNNCWAAKYRIEQRPIGPTLSLG
jgi:hypothetical protein